MFLFDFLAFMGMLYLDLISLEEEEKIDVGQKGEIIHGENSHKVVYDMNKGRFENILLRLLLEE